MSVSASLLGVVDWNNANGLRPDEGKVLFLDYVIKALEGETAVQSYCARKVGSLFTAFGRHFSAENFQTLLNIVSSDEALLELIAKRAELHKGQHANSNTRLRHFWYDVMFFVDQCLERKINVSERNHQLAVLRDYLDQIVENPESSVSERHALERLAEALSKLDVMNPDALQAVKDQLSQDIDNLKPKQQRRSKHRQPSQRGYGLTSHPTVENSRSECKLGRGGHG